MSDFGTFRRHKWALPLETAMVVGVLFVWADHDWPHLAVALLALGISFLPLLAERRWHVRLPAVFQISYVALVFAALFCGAVLRLNDHLAWWSPVMFILGIALLGYGLRLQKHQRGV